MYVLAVALSLRLLINFLWQQREESQQFGVMVLTNIGGMKLMVNF